MMFGQITGRKRSQLGAAFEILALVYHVAVRSIRSKNGNAVMALISSVVQSAVFVLAFYFMFTLLGLRGAAIRGDFLLYIMTGVFLFMTHIKAVGGIVGADGPAAPMMQHAPMNTTIALLAAALAALYLQVMTIICILSVYHVIWGPIYIQNPPAALGMLLLAWFTGVSVGMVMRSIRPWFPGLTPIISAVYQRANMVASGKMFVANQLPGYMLAMFDWNPLFHVIDQERGFTFINYNPHFSSISYPIYVSLALLTVGLMAEFYARKKVSLSWDARR